MLNKTVRTVGLLALVICLGIAMGGCSGGDGGGPPSLRVTSITASVPTGLENTGIVCIQFTVRGPVNDIVDILAEYLLQGSQTAIVATEVPENVQAANAIVSSGTTNLDLGSSGEATFSFYWAAGQDLGFGQATVEFCITPFDNGDPNAPNGQQLCTSPFQVDAQQPPQTSTGPGPGATPGNPSGGTGRADHGGHHVRSTVGPDVNADPSVLLLGGYNDAMPPNAFDTADRFSFQPDPGGAMPPAHNLADTETFPGMQRKVLAASSFFLEPSGPFAGRPAVVISGGVDRRTPPALPPFGSGSPFADAAASLGSQVNGATEYSSADVWTHDSGGMLTAGGMLSGPRFAHTSTWIPDNRVVVIGGATGTGGTIAGLDSIEIYDPITNTWTLETTVLPTPRVQHTACLLPDGRIFISGGYDPSQPTSNTLPNLIYDPTPVGPGQPVISVTAPPGVTTGRVEHACTRLFDGRILVTGGRDVNDGSLMDSAFLFNPATMTHTALTMPQAVAEHRATLMGNGRVLVTGGVTTSTGPNPEDFTNAAIVFRTDPDQFTPVNFMNTDRGSHSATAAATGSVYVIGGRNGSPNANNFLDDIEFYAFSNAVPVVTGPMTSAAASPNLMGITFEVADVNQDGGYAYVRFRTTPGSGPWSPATIDSQITPSMQTVTPPTFRITPGTNTFVWNFTMDGVSTSTLVEIEIIPVGAVLGSPTSFVAATPN